MSICQKRNLFGFCLPADCAFILDDSVGCVCRSNQFNAVVPVMLSLVDNKIMPTDSGMPVAVFIKTPLLRISMFMA